MTFYFFFGIIECLASQNVIKWKEGAEFVEQLKTFIPSGWQWIYTFNRISEKQVASQVCIKAGSKWEA